MDRGTVGCRPEDEPEMSNHSLQSRPEGMPTLQGSYNRYSDDIIVSDVQPSAFTAQDQTCYSSDAGDPSRLGLQDLSTELVSPKSIGFSSSRASEPLHPAAILGHHRSVVIQQRSSRENGIDNPTPFTAFRHPGPATGTEVLEKWQGTGSQKEHKTEEKEECDEPDLVVQPPFGGYSLSSADASVCPIHLPSPSATPAESEMSSLANALLHGANLFDKSLTPIQSFKSYAPPRTCEQCPREKEYGSLPSSGATGSVTDDQSEDVTTPTHLEPFRLIPLIEPQDGIRPLCSPSFPMLHQHIGSEFINVTQSPISSYYPIAVPFLEGPRISSPESFPMVLGLRTAKRKMSEEHEAQCFISRQGNCKASRLDLQGRASVRPMAIPQMPELGQLQRTLPSHTRRIRAAASAATSEKKDNSRIAELGEVGSMSKKPEQESLLSVFQ